MCSRWWTTGGASPGPATVELDFQREAQERPDEDDQPKDSDVLERGLDGDGPDDVGGHQELQPEQDAAGEDGSDGPVNCSPHPRPRAGRVRRSPGLRPGPRGQSRRRGSPRLWRCHPWSARSSSPSPVPRRGRAIPRGQLTGYVLVNLPTSAAPPSGDVRHRPPPGGRVPADPRGARPSVQRTGCPSPRWRSRGSGRCCPAACR